MTRVVMPTSSSQHRYSFISDNGGDSESPVYTLPFLSHINDYLRHHNLDFVLVISTVVLISFTAIERISFKVMVDRMLPYKFVLIEIIFLASCFVFAIITAYKLLFTKDISSSMLKFPHSKLIGIAVLDSLQFLGAVYSAVGVSPTMTVILMHSSTLFIVLGSKIVFPARVYGSLHAWGVALISVAIAFSLFKIVWNDYYFNSSSEAGYSATKCSLLYLAASAVQGLSTLYKEKALVEWSQPISIHYLSAWLFFYQFLVTLGLSVVFYLVEDVIGQQRSIFHSIYFGWECFLGQTPSDQARDDDSKRYIVCAESMWLIMSFVCATILILVSINVVLQYSSQVVSRAVSAAIFAAFLVLWVYDLQASRTYHSHYILGGKVGLFDVAAMLILLVGMEIYGRDPEPDVEMITHYSPASVAHLSSSIGYEKGEIEVVPKFAPLTKKSPRTNNVGVFQQQEQQQQLLPVAIQQTYQQR